MPRTTDPIWKFFERTLKVNNKGKWAKCKKCGTGMQGIPSRLKKHYEECWLEKVLEADAVEDDPMSILADEMQMTSDDPVPGTSSSSLEPSTSVSTTATMASQKRTRVTHRYASLSVVKDSAVVSTSDAYAERIGEQIGRYFFATNTPFSHADREEFIQMYNVMRPGYQPPSRKQLSEGILGSVVVSMCLDGWSNVHMEPIVCCSVVLPSGATYLVDTVDTSGSSHTAEYLAELARNSICKCKSLFGAEVRL